MKYKLIFAALLCSFVLANAKDTPKYAVKSIPPELIDNVNIVWRVNRSIFEIHSASKATHHVFKAITILNANGKEHAREIVGYDKLSKVTSIKGRVYDADGMLIKKLKSSEIYDQSAYDGFSLYSDNRLKAMDLKYGSYPYTVEFEYQMEYKYLFHIPGFVVVPDEKMAVEEAHYKLIYPKTLKPKYFSRNITAQPIVAPLENDIESLSWTFKNVKPIKLEPFSDSKREQLPAVYAAPTTFEFDGYFGKMDTWDGFGEWINLLNKDRNSLPEGTQQKIISLTGKLPTREEKIKAVYEYMQNKTRYVSIQLGIGGYQPFEASVVDQNGYGDCKALSNYMVSMLAVVGIKAHYVLVHAGKNSPEFNTGFPSSQFNHAVVCVPNEKDTLWLECTSQTNPFGYMGSFTGNRKALAITENGAKIVNTPVYNEQHNVQSRTATVTVDAKGNAQANVRTTYTGLQYENDHLNFVLGNQFEEQQKWLRKNTGIPSFDIRSFSMKNRKEKIPSAVVDLDLTLNRLATVSGKRLFLTPNLMNRMTFIPEKVDSRKTNVVLRNAFTDYDTIHYSIPEEIYPEFLPEPFRIQSRFGEYEARFTLEQGNVVYTRRLVMRGGEFPPESYTELIDFYKKINKADHAKLVFLNKT